MQRDVNAADRNDDKRDHDEQRGDQTEFLADDGKNEIGMMLGNPAEFLPAVAKAKTGPAAGAESDHGLIRLKTHVILALLGIKPA